MSKNNIREGVKVQFSDKEREIYPVSLRRLRKLTKAMKRLEAVEAADTEEVNDDAIDIMVEIAAIILEQVDPELAGDVEALEDVIDIKNFSDLVSAGMGADPNA